MCEIIVLWLFHPVFSGMAVYNVVIVCIVGTPVVTFVHEKQFEASFIVTGICILFSTTSTLCIVFVPKVGFPKWSYKPECYSFKKKMSSLDFQNEQAWIFSFCYPFWLLFSSTEVNIKLNRFVWLTNFPSFCTMQFRLTDHTASWLTCNPSQVLLQHHASFFTLDFSFFFSLFFVRSTFPLQASLTKGDGTKFKMISRRDMMVISAIL